jgi:hypothetical protein
MVSAFTIAPPAAKQTMFDSIRFPAPSHGFLPDSMEASFGKAAFQTAEVLYGTRLRNV